MKWKFYVIAFLCVIVVYELVIFRNNIDIDTIRQGFSLKWTLLTDTEGKTDDKRIGIFRQRLQMVNDGCFKINKTFYDSISVRNEIQIDPVHNIRYCPIPKIGTTFWLRALRVLASNGRLKSPFELSRAKTGLESWNRITEEKKNMYSRSGQSFMFVREPYARLFSGYENKIYVANPSFMKGMGPAIVKMIRGKTIPYSFDVTFAEFIQYVINISQNEAKINPHFRPMYQHCDPCKIHFDYIGYLETFADDANYLFDKWRNEFNDFTLKFDDFEKETAIDTAETIVSHLFSSKKFVSEEKIPFIKLMLRVWRDLQIRGYLSKSIEFPFSGDVSGVTKKVFMDAIAKAVHQPQNWTAVKLQRHEALVQAYRQVPLEVMEKLRQFVHWDCVLFGYNDKPTDLFDRNTPIEDDFLYLDGMA